MKNEHFDLACGCFLLVVHLIFNHYFEARPYDEYSWASSNTADWADMIQNPTIQLHPSPYNTYVHVVAKHSIHSNASD